MTWWRRSTSGGVAEGRAGPGAAPPGFPADFAAVWGEIASLAPLSRADRLTLELASYLVMDLRRSGPDWPAERFAVLLSCLSALGVARLPRPGEGSIHAD